MHLIGSFCSGPGFTEGPNCISLSNPFDATGYTPYVGDFNGDGKADILFVSALYVWACASTPTQVAGENGNCRRVGNGGADFYDFRLADINGDGLTDLLFVGDNDAYYCKAPDFLQLIDSCARITGDIGSRQDYRLFSGDFNGDGKQDLYLVGQYDNRFCPGPVAAQGICTRVDTLGADWRGRFATHIADFDNDGRSDIFLAGDGFSYVCLANAAIKPTITLATDCRELPMTYGWHSANMHVTDFNGDGAADLLFDWRCTSYGCGNWFLATGAPQPPDLLTTITNGLGAQNQITYLPMTNSDVYSDSATAGVGFRPPVYPLSRVKFPYYVVSSVRASNGIGGNNETTYFYRDGRADAQGRGFSGYAEMTRKDLASTLQTISRFRQDYPYTGMAWQQDTQVIGAGHNLKRIHNTAFANKHYGGTRYFPYVSASTETNRDINGAAISTIASTFDYDLFGNRILAERTTDDNHASRETVQYQNDTANWILGLPTLHTVRNTLPDTTTLTRTTSFAYQPGTTFRTQEVIEPATPSLRLTTDYTPDAFGNVRTITVSGIDIQTRTTTHTYDPQGRFIINTLNPLNHPEARQYDARFGGVTRYTSPNNIVTTWEYDTLGRKRLESRVDGSETRHDYVLCTTECTGAARHYAVTTATANPVQVEFFDQLNRPVARAWEDFSATSWNWQRSEYDAIGRAARTSRPYLDGETVYWTTFTHDELNRVRTKTNPDNGVTLTTYNGREISVRNARLHTTLYQKNSLGQITRVDDARTGWRTYAYDPFGNLLRTQDQSGHLTTMTYDLLGRKRTITDPDMGHWQYYYNVLGELTAQTDAKSQTAALTYDKLGRTLTRNEPGLASTWTYDTAVKGIGKLHTSTTNLGYSRVHSYDSLSRPQSVTTTIDGTPYTMSTGYDAVSRPRVVTYPTGFTVRNVYTAHGYLERMLNHSTEALIWETYGRNADGQVLTEGMGNGLVGGRGYDPRTGRLNVVYAGPSWTDFSVAALEFNFDLVGNLQNRTDYNTGLAETFVYDELNRLTQVNGPAPKSFGYDATGNLLSKTDVGSYQYLTGGSTRPHAVTQTVKPIGPSLQRETSYSYDLNGSHTVSTFVDRNTTTQEIVNSGPVHNVTWNAFNMPASISYAGGAANTFVYGPEHQRVKRTNPGATTVYPTERLDQHTYYEKTTFSGGLIEHKHYIFAGGQLVSQFTQRSTAVNDTYYFSLDHLGSTSVITDQTGNIVERLAYDAHGKRRNTDGTDATAPITSAITPHGFTGHEHMDGLGLINMNARVYEPSLGKFLSADPSVPRVFDTQSHNRYSYVVNNPLSRVDPSGMTDRLIVPPAYDHQLPDHASLGYGSAPRQTGEISEGLHARRERPSGTKPYWEDHEIELLSVMEDGLFFYSRNTSSGTWVSSQYATDEERAFLIQLGWRPGTIRFGAELRAAMIDMVRRHFRLDDSSAANSAEIGGAAGGFSGFFNRRLPLDLRPNGASMQWFRYSLGWRLGASTIIGAGLGLEFYIVYTGTEWIMRVTGAHDALVDFLMSGRDAEIAAWLNSGQVLPGSVTHHSNGTTTVWINPPQCGTGQKCPNRK